MLEEGPNVVLLFQKFLSFLRLEGIVSAYCYQRVKPLLESSHTIEKSFHFRSDRQHIITLEVLIHPKDT